MSSLSNIASKNLEGKQPFFEWSLNEENLSNVNLIQGSALQFEKGHLYINNYNRSGDKTQGFEIQFDEPISANAVQIAGNFKSASDETVKVYFECEGSPYNEKTSKQAGYKKGGKRVEIVAEPVSSVKKIRINPGQNPGDFIIHSLKITFFS